MSVEEYLEFDYELRKRIENKENLKYKSVKSADELIPD